MKKIITKYAEISEYNDVRFHKNGQPELIVPKTKLVLNTPLGQLIPQHTSDDMRRPKVEQLSFFEDGSLRSLALENPTVVPTPIGELSAELVNFYPSGALRRIFPVNGKLSAYWSAANEKTLTTAITVPTSLGPITAHLIGLHFYESGALRSLTLWPDEVVKVESPAGPVRVRIGLAFYESGALRSLEPQNGMVVNTPVGQMEAYDPDPEGVCGDENSLVFSEDGLVSALATASDALEVRCREGVTKIFRSGFGRNACEDETMDIKPLRVGFQPGAVLIADADGRKRVNLDVCEVEVKRGLTKPKPVLFGCGS